MRLDKCVEDYTESVLAGKVQLLGSSLTMGTTETGYNAEIKNLKKEYQISM